MGNGSARPARAETETFCHPGRTPFRDLTASPLSALPHLGFCSLPFNLRRQAPPPSPALGHWCLGFDWTLGLCHSSLASEAPVRQCSLRAASSLFPVCCILSTFRTLASRIDPRIDLGMDRARNLGTETHPESDLDHDLRRTQTGTQAASRTTTQTGTWPGSRPGCWPRTKLRCWPSSRRRCYTS